MCFFFIYKDIYNNMYVYVFFILLRQDMRDICYPSSTTDRKSLTS